MNKTEWLNTCVRITEDPDTIYSEATGMILEGVSETVAVLQFEIGVICESVRDGKTMYHTVCSNSDIYDSDFNTVADFLWDGHAHYYAEEGDAE